MLESERVEGSLRIQLSGVQVPFRGEAGQQGGAEVYRRYREGLAGIVDSCAVDDFVEFVLSRGGGS